MEPASKHTANKNELAFLILETVEQLLHQSTLSHISVAQICEAAHISRAAFYQRFTNKYEVATWHYDLLCAEHIDNLDALGYYQANIMMLNCFKQYRSFYRHAFTEQGEHSLTEYAIQRRGSRLEEIIFIEKALPYDTVFSYQIAAFNTAAVMAVVNWIRQNMPLPCSRIAELLNLIIPPKIRRALEGTQHEANSEQY